jgi:hypothetical protein
MTVADVLAWFLLASSSFLALVGAWLVSHALWPAAVERCGREYARPMRATLLGLAVALPVLVIGLALLNEGDQVPALGVLGMALLLLVLVVGVFGASGLARVVGGGLVSPGNETQPWMPSLRGGLALATVFLLPFAGWFILLPCALASGLGAALISLRDRQRS